MSELRNLIGLAFSLVLGMTALITSCILDHNWYILSISLFYILSPIPTLLPNCCCGEKVEVESVACDWIYFTTTGFVVSSFALPIVMFGIGFITGLALSLVFTSNVIVLLSILGIFVFVVETDYFDSFI